MKRTVVLIVLLVGIGCLCVYGRRKPPSYGEMMQMKQADFERGQILKQEKLERYTKKRDGRKEAAAKLRENWRVLRLEKKLYALEERVSSLEHALTGELTYVIVPVELQSEFDAEVKKRSTGSMEKIKKAVRLRVLSCVDPNFFSEPSPAP